RLPFTSAGRSRVPIPPFRPSRIRAGRLALYIPGKRCRPRVLPSPLLPFSSSGSAAASSSPTSRLGSRKRNPKVSRTSPSFLPPRAPVASLVRRFSVVRANCCLVVRSIPPVLVSSLARRASVHVAGSVVVLPCFSCSQAP
uniref:Uncharacterized protein n=1 Tax=Aegilops tauschii subsp. strangulata TaxID=200361 RepID=A0A453MCA0_AEGTS